MLRININGKIRVSTDKNGNILSLQRNGDRDTDGAQMVNLIDNLEYTYDTNNKNLLVKVDDDSSSPQGFKNGSNTGNDYVYDANGNMTIDNNKGIRKIVYNHLNLPTAINFGGKSYGIDIQITCIITQDRVI